jgi:N utilization substance protein B
VTDRRRAREAALQALYFWEVGGADPGVALATVFAEHQPEATPATREFAAQLVMGVTGTTGELDRRLAGHLEHWRIERLATVDRLILRIAAWELEHDAETPVAVVLDEAVGLARTFSGDESARFVNGVLDPLARGLGR